MPQEMNMKPIIPFEPAASDKIPAGPEWIYQVKWDGIKLIVLHQLLFLLQL